MDTSIFYFFYNLGQKLNVDWLIIFFADYLVFIFIIIFFLYLLKQKSLREKIYYFNLFLLVEILARGILTEVIRFFYARQRPFMVLPITNIVNDNAHSFPSGHSVVLFSLALVLFVINKRWGWVFLGVAVLVGVSRIMAGVHWASDIVGGLAVAALSFYLIYYFVLSKKKFFKEISSDADNSQMPQTKNP